MLLCLLTITSVDAQNRKPSTNRNSGTARKATTGRPANTGKPQGTNAANNPQVIFSLPDDKKTEEDFLSSMNTQLYRMKKYVEIPSTYQFQNENKTILYKLIFAVRKDDGILVRMLSQSNTDMISYLSSMKLQLGDETINGEMLNKVYLTEDYKINGVRYVDEFFFRTNKLTDKIDLLTVSCIDKDDMNNNVIFQYTLRDIEVRESEGTDFLYQINDNKLEVLKTDNNSFISSLGFDNQVEEADLDGLNFKVQKVISFNGKICVDFSITNNTNRKKRITFSYNNALPFVVTSIGRKLVGTPNGTHNGDDISIDIEGNSSQNERITFDEKNDEKTSFIQLLHIFDTQSGRSVVFKNLPVEDQPKPHGELKFGMTWSQARDLGYVYDSQGGNCTYTVYEGVKFDKCTLAFKDNRIDHVEFVLSGQLASNIFEKLSNSFNKKYTSKTIDKTIVGYDHHDQVKIWVTNNLNYRFILHLNDPFMGSKSITLTIYDYSNK